ncbi:hypothetical protein [Geodermatophilus marinus]|nr:hypothetical protein [Geodermatophilus sp. LHW52908]
MTSHVQEQPGVAAADGVIAGRPVIDSNALSRAVHSLRTGGTR